MLVNCLPHPWFSELVGFCRHHVGLCFIPRSFPISTPPNSKYPQFRNSGISLQVFHIFCPIAHPVRRETPSLLLQHPPKSWLFIGMSNHSKVDLPLFISWGWSDSIVGRTFALCTVIPIWFPIPHMIPCSPLEMIPEHRARAKGSQEHSMMCTPLPSRFLFVLCFGERDSTVISV